MLSGGLFPGLVINAQQKGRRLCAGAAALRIIIADGAFWSNLIAKNRALPRQRAGAEIHDNHRKL